MVLIYPGHPAVYLIISNMLQVANSSLWLIEACIDLVIRLLIGNLVFNVLVYTRNFFRIGGCSYTLKSYTNRSGSSSWIAIYTQQCWVNTLIIWNEWSEWLYFSFLISYIPNLVFLKTIYYAVFIKGRPSKGPLDKQYPLESPFG